MNVFEKIIEHLEEAKKAATLKNAGFGFSDDRIEIKSVHFGDDDRGRTGDIMHPTDYVRNITRLHHETWIISPINAALELIRAHADTMRKTELLLNQLNDIQRIIEQAKAGQK